MICSYLELCHMLDCLQLKGQTKCVTLKTVYRFVFRHGNNCLFFPL